MEIQDWKMKSKSRRYGIWKNVSGGKGSIEASLAAEGLAQPEGIYTKTNQAERLSN